jgi:hypothetical protein
LQASAQAEFHAGVLAGLHVGRLARGKDCVPASMMACLLAWCIASIPSRRAAWVTACNQAWLPARKHPVLTACMPSCNPACLRAVMLAAIVFHREKLPKQRLGEMSDKHYGMPA